MQNLVEFQISGGKMLAIAAILFIITALLHIAIPFIYGRGQDTIGIAVYGVIYLVIGGLLLTTAAGWVPFVALILTAIGAAAAFVQRNANQKLLTFTWIFIAIDAFIILLLVLNWLV